MMGSYAKQSAAESPALVRYCQAMTFTKNIID